MRRRRPSLMLDRLIDVYLAGYEDFKSKGERDKALFYLKLARHLRKFIPSKGAS